MQSTSDITPSIKSIRGRRLSCRTFQTEDEIVRDLESEFGEICVPQLEIDKIYDRETKLLRRARASKKSLIKTFQQRKKAIVIQNLIEYRNCKSTNNNCVSQLNRRRPSTSGVKYSSLGKSGKTVVINEIELEY